ncbi:MAG: glycosyl hydrolase [Acidobacteriota bacterium]
MIRLPRASLTAASLILMCGALALSPPAAAETAAEDSPWKSSTFSGLAFRNIGPAVTSGRISDLAVDPRDEDTIYVAVASGGIFKTTNHGTTWKPIFDGQTSYSIGSITLDPNNPSVVWVGTGENNSQRSVGYGDGVYKSLDGGSSWRHMGLEESEHIGMIAVDPRDSDVVYVASQGPLWSAGGDRGLFKTTDGGETWTPILEISEHTGISEVHMDPRDPDTLLAVAYQRRRHVWTLVNGGPESGVHKSTDGGATWRKLAGGLPGGSGDVGRIGLTISPVSPDVVYAIIEAAGEGKAGVYRSRDRGETWQKRSSYVSGSPQYYQELFADPHDVDRVYSMDTWMHRTDDGGATWNRVDERSKHVDNHALWIDPEDPDHLLAGCDGGLYETWDGGSNWTFYGNLPITQFYRMTLSNDEPFYHVYGGTQDNFTLGGPSRTTNVHGIRNSDWIVTLGGDGFQPQVDPDDPNIIYSQWQYGNLARFDRRTGEITDIQPRPGKDGPPLVWNWDAALSLSPHDGKRLYFGADRLFRSDDRGDTWRAISGDLTRNIDRLQLEAMGRVWPIDTTVSRNRSTSIYGNIVTVDESPLAADLLYAGTDDGLVQVSEDGGENWRAVESVPGVPERTYVNRLRASLHDADTVFAAFNNHKNGDFKPYLLKSTDRGRTWTSIASGLPERGSVYAVEQDPVRAELLFAGTEFGVFFTVDGGATWVQLKGGVPPIAIRDLEIHHRDGDLVLGSFGRGFFVLDDIGPLREITGEALEAPFTSFSVRRALAYNPWTPHGIAGKAFLGDSFFTAPNPPFGAVLTYYLSDGLKTLQDARHAEEKERIEAGEAPDMPDWEELRAESREKAPRVVITVRDAAGQIVRRLDGPTGAGFHRVAWDLRWPSPLPVELTPREPGPFDAPRVGPPALPGTYTATFETVVRGERTAVGEPQTFEVVALGAATLPAPDRAALDSFSRQVADLQRAVQGTVRAVADTRTRLRHLERATLETPGVEDGAMDRLAALESDLEAVERALWGDSVVRRAAEPVVPGVAERIDRIATGLWTASAAPTATQLEQYSLAGELFTPALENLRGLVERRIPAFEAELEKAGAPWTPGRVPAWPGASAPPP